MMHRAVFRMPVTAWLLGIANPQSIKRLGHFLTADCKSAGTPNGGQDISGAADGGFAIPYPIDMLATAWLLGIANPQSIKRLGHFLTADCKSAGTPNGGQDISGAADGGFAIPYPIDMLATAWLLGIANPQSIKRLGHFFDGG